MEQSTEDGESCFEGTVHLTIALVFMFFLLGSWGGHLVNVWIQLGSVLERCSELGHYGRHLLLGRVYLAPFQSQRAALVPCGVLLLSL